MNQTTSNAALKELEYDYSQLSEDHLKLLYKEATTVRAIPETINKHEQELSKLNLEMSGFYKKLSKENKKIENVMNLEEDVLKAPEYFTLYAYLIVSLLSATLVTYFGKSIIVPEDYYKPVQFTILFMIIATSISAIQYKFKVESSPKVIMNEAKESFKTKTDLGKEYVKLVKDRIAIIQHMNVEIKTDVKESDKLLKQIVKEELKLDAMEKEMDLLANNTAN